MLGQVNIFKDLDNNSGKVLGEHLGFKDKNCVFFGVGGLGEPVLRALLLMGAKVLVSRRSEDKLEKMLTEYQGFAASPAHLISKAADVTKQESVDEVCALAQDRFGSVDLVVFFPGSIVKGANVAHGESPTKADTSAILQQIDADYLGGIRIIKGLEPLLKKSHEKGERPRIVLIDSIGAGRAGGSPQSASVGYNAAKVSLRNFAQMLAVDWAKWCSINTIAPGPVLTDLNRERMGHDAPRGKRAISNTPAGEYIKFDDPVGATLFLLSPVLGSGVIAQTVMVDNGLTNAAPY
ncbi:MAG: SDR family oxidoreductase [Proteobacteria bacterium]|nr:SDR family oxidoreductase [Pseudomonadota bacterium]